MDGYSVEEAAEVLGIPQGRVWELIARGVLAGVAEGRSDMRVILKPAATPSADPTRLGGGGNGGRSGVEPANGENQVEASPFRELLTEFRNLTERYGQALLALGEARGEVAALRSRVEVIEARMDMRLPLRSASTVAWELPDRYAAEAAHASEPPAAPKPAPVAEAAVAEPAASEPAVTAAEPSAAGVALPEPPLPGDEAVQPVNEVIQAEEPPPVEPESHLAAEAQPEAFADSAAEAGAAAAPEPMATHEAEPEAVADVRTEPDVESVSTDTEPFPEVTFVHPAEPTAEPPRRRVTGGRAAVAGLAEALARAEDPTLADLPGAREAAAALAALQQAVDSPPSADTSPHEEAESPPKAHAESPPEAQPESGAEAADAERPEPEPEPEAEPEAEPEPTRAAFAPIMSEVEEEPIPAEVEGVAETAPPEAPVESPQSVERADAPGDEAPSVYSTDVVEPDWFADGDFTWLDATDRPSEPPAEAGREMDHVEREAEAPAVDALQEAFDQPGTEASTSVQPGPPATEPVAAEEAEPQATDQPDALAPQGEAPDEAIQEAFDAPDASHRAEAEAWPPRDRAPIAGPGGVGFGLFRPADDAPRARTTPAAPPTDEEAILWFGDEFEAGDLEVAAPGWRDQERLDMTPEPGPDDPATSTEPATEPEPEPQSPATEPEPPATEPSASAPTEEEIASLASQGWDSAEVEAIRSYLDRAPGIAQPRGDQPQGAQPHEGQAQDPSYSARDQDWLRGRRGPAAGAYRRLRRLLG